MHMIWNWEGKGRISQGLIGRNVDILPGSMLVRGVFLLNMRNFHQVHGSCLEACAEAAAGFADLHAVVEQCRLLARCLFLRRLLADAAATEAAALLPHTAASLEASALAAPSCSGPHACDLLDLPRLSFHSVCSTGSTSLHRCECGSKAVCAVEERGLIG